MESIFFMVLPCQMKGCTQQPVIIRMYCRPISAVGADHAAQIEMDNVKGGNTDTCGKRVVVAVAHVCPIARAQLGPVPGVEFGTHTGILRFFIGGKAAGRGQVNI
jgi:hypothetical protein